jgi:hypothetical protein
MTKRESVLVVILFICLGVIVFSSLRLLSERGAIGVKEKQLNELHEKQIRLYDKHIVDLQGIIVTLQSERDSLENEKSKIKIVTIHEIDSIRALPFTGKRFFFTREISRLDSLRTRHADRN